MATTSITLTGEWQQITTGAETKLIQSLSGKFALCESASHPDEGQAWHIFTEVIITPPSVVWVKSFTLGNKLVVTNMS